MSLSETLDRLLNKGAVIGGDIVISIADVDLIYLGVNVVLTSVETIRRTQKNASREGRRPQVRGAAAASMLGPRGHPGGDSCAEVLPAGDECLEE